MKKKTSDRGYPQGNIFYVLFQNMPNNRVYFLDINTYVENV